ncbi:capsular biosynthesis protein [Gammaproteobacteria bacterium]|nr:capsular biosynthesis protein [Gammaproteobacteria bacterium]
MRICIDIDGVICQLKLEGQTYEELLPVEGAAEKISSLRRSGHYIILNTARHMKTCEGNTGKVLKRISLITLQWLDKHDVEYDEIYFGKPWANIYIDDNAYRFTSWDSIDNSGEFLPHSTESKLK